MRVRGQLCCLSVLVVSVVSVAVVSVLVVLVVVVAQMPGKTSSLSSENFCSCSSA